MAHYRKPRRINVVSLPLFLLIAAGAYVAIMFGPAYYRQFEVKEVLGEYAVRYMAVAGGPGLAASEQEDRLRDDAEAEMRDRGIPDAAVRVRFTKSAHDLTASAEYVEVIVHPLVDRTTKLHFTPSVTRPLR